LIDLIFETKVNNVYHVELGYGMEGNWAAWQTHILLLAYFSITIKPYCNDTTVNSLYSSTYNANSHENLFANSCSLWQISIRTGDALGVTKRL
jgi:hypothetical protein